MFLNRNCCGRQNMMGGAYDPGFASNQPQMECPIVEPTTTNCVEREFYHEVPHVCPMHTHVINRHIYKHTYTPQYTCSEENQVCNIDCGKCPGAGY